MGAHGPEDTDWDDIQRYVNEICNEDLLEALFHYTGNYVLVEGYNIRLRNGQEFTDIWMPNHLIPEIATIRLGQFLAGENPSGSRTPGTSCPCSKPSRHRTPPNRRPPPTGQHGALQPNRWSALRPLHLKVDNPRGRCNGRSEGPVHSNLRKPSLEPLREHSQPELLP